MTDDIVTRLRELAAKQDAKWCDPTDAPLTMYQVAADEIERLRNDVKVRDLQILANFKAMDAMHKELYGDAE